MTSINTTHQMEDKKKMIPDETEIILGSGDTPSVTFATTYGIIKISVTLKNMIDDIENIKDPIPLPNVSANVLKLILEYCTHLATKPVNKRKRDDDEEEISDDPWEVEFCEKMTNRDDMRESIIFPFIQATNYLDIKPIFNMACKTVAGIIEHHKVPEKIREVFGLKGDFTPEEEEKIKKENEWCVDD